ncbi:MAG: hypothetical protein OEX01_01255 [Candidatus Bathyarchaeota archaeon]|nr:hypothetical protein [Candidatus Bathyarchaeota archaeon]
MAYTVEKDYGNHITIASKLQDLLNNATVSTLHTAQIIKIGSDFFLAYIVYE